MDTDKVDFIFTYQSPRDDAERDAYAKLGIKFRELAHFVNELTPEGPGQTVAIRKLAEARMAANAAIALQGQF